MKIKESRLRQIIKEAVYKEIGKKVINEGRVDEFLGGLFGFGKKKKKKQAKATDADTPETTEDDIAKAMADHQAAMDRAVNEDSIGDFLGAELVYIDKDGGGRTYRRLSAGQGQLKGDYAMAQKNHDYDGTPKPIDEAEYVNRRGEAVYYYIPTGKPYSRAYYSQATGFSQRRSDQENGSAVDPAHIDWDAKSSSSDTNIFNFITDKAMRKYPNWAQKFRDK